MDNIFQDITERLTALGVTRRQSEHPEAALREVEQVYGFSLPEDYRFFLQKYGSFYWDKDVGYQPTKSFPGSSEEGLEPIGFFYGLDDNNLSLTKEIECYLGRMPKELIPIADSPGGDQICLGIEGDVYGKVFFWDHEQEYMEYTAEEHLWWNVHEIAESFTRFMMSFQEVEEEPVDTSGIVSVRMSDDFRALVEEYKRKQLGRQDEDV